MLSGIFFAIPKCGMQNKGMRHFGIFLLLWLPLWLHAQVEFKASATRSEITQDERLRVDFMLNRAPERFEPPAFRDFVVVMGPMQSSGTSVRIVNGKVTRSEQHTYSYVLAPKRAGNLQIEPATAVVDGQTYHTQPIRIQVFKSSRAGNAAIQNTKPGNRQAGASGGNEDVFLRLELTNRNPYVGQAIGAVYKMYFRKGTRVADMAQPNISEPKGFWAETISDKFEDLGRDTINGQIYRVYALRRMMLIPQHEGKLVITPQRFDVVLLKRVLREWGMIQYYDDVPQTYHLSSGRVVVNVKPLPEKGKPVDFSGAVGTFDFLVDAVPTAVQTGRDLSISVKVMGKGNLNMFDLPKPVFPPAWETYDPEHRVKTTPTFSGYRGTVSDVYTVIPQEPGMVKLPPVSFVYFDPYAKEYKRITKSFPPIEVSGAPVNTSRSTSAPAAPGTRLSGIVRKGRWQQTGHRAFVLRPAFGRWMWAPFVLFALIWLAVYVLRHRRIDPEKLRNERESRYIRRLLSDARKHSGDKEHFYGLLERALMAYFKNRLNLPANALNRRSVLEKLHEKNPGNDLIERLQDLWNRIDMARYAPGSDAARQSDLDQIKDLLTQLDKKLKK